MLSKRLQRILATVSKLCVKCGASHYYVDEDKLIAYKSTDPRVKRRLRWNYHLAEFWATASFLLLIKYYVHGERHRFKITLLFWICGISLMSCFSIFRFYQNETLSCTNGLFKRLETFKHTFMPNFDTESSRINFLFDFAILMYCGLCTILCFLGVFIAIIDPRQIVFLGDLIPYQYYSYVPWGILIASYHTYIMIRLFLNMALLGILGLTYIFYMMVIVAHELCDGLSSYRALETLRDPNNICLVYRSFQVLHANIFVFCGQYCAYFHVALTIIPVYANSILIRFYEELDIVMRIILIFASIGTMGIWLMFLQTGKHLYMKGKRTLWSWKLLECKDKMEKRIFSKFRKSCLLILICHGKTFVVRRMTPFTYTKGIVRGTFKSLMTLVDKLP